MSNRERVKGNKAKASGQASETCHEIKTVEEENSHNFACILLASNHINFLVQFGINQHLLNLIDYKLHSSYGLVQMVNF